MTTDYLETFFTSAEALITDGVSHSREDDPHRFKTLGREFDGGKAMRRLTVDYLANDRMRIALSFVGTEDGEAKEVQVFAFTVQGPHQGTLQ